MNTRIGTVDEYRRAESTLVLVDSSGARARKAVAAAAAIMMSLAALDVLVLIATIATIRR